MPMSRKTARRVLWVAALLLVPVPLLAIAEAFVPVARIFELGLVVLITILVEGPGGVAPILLTIFLVHAVVDAAVLWGVAWLLTWGLERVAPAALGPVVLALVVAGCVWGAALPIYHTPFHAQVADATLLEIYP